MYSQLTGGTQMKLIRESFSTLFPSIEKSTKNKVAEIVYSYAKP